MSRFIFCALFLVIGTQAQAAFELKLPYEKTNFVNAKAMMCKHIAYGLTNEVRVAPNYIDIAFPQFIWTGSEKSQVSIDEIRVILHDSRINNGQPYECKFTPADIKYLYYKSGPDRNGQTQVQTWPSSITTSQSSEYWRKEKGMSACPIRCGGIPIAPNSGRFATQAKVFVKATEQITKEDGTVTTVPHTSEKSVAIGQKGNWF